ncbi:hypothetical protein HDV05_001722, partial [Chytridiales sp. JEL 0842]
MTDTAMTPLDIATEESKNLSPSSSPQARSIAARTLLQLLESDIIRPIDLIRANVVPPLLHAAQTPLRSPDTMQPLPSTPSNVLQMADSALLLLGSLCSAGVSTMKEAGWHIAEDDRGRPLYVHPESGTQSQDPPDLSGVFVDEHGEAVLKPDEQWALTLLMELTMLISPYVTSKRVFGDQWQQEEIKTVDEPVLVWPATVRYYQQPASSDPTREAILVLDIVKDDDD